MVSGKHKGIIFSLLLMLADPGLADATTTLPELQTGPYPLPPGVADRSLLSPDSSFHYRWSGSNWSRFKRDTYVYNLDGQLSQATTLFLLGGQWLNLWRSTLSYDPQGHLVEWLYEGGDESDWYNVWREQYSYDDAGTLIQMTHAVDEGAGWQSTERLNYAYAQDGRLAEEITQIRVGGSWLNLFRKAYHYTPTGQIDSCWIQDYEYDTDLWLEDSLQVFSYDAEGRQLQWRLMAWDGAAWNFVQRESDSYTDAGQLAAEILENYYGSHWFYMERRLHEYDVNGWLALSTIQDWDYDETVWFDEARELFSHDVEGNLLESSNQIWNPDSANWVNEFRQAWFYPTPSGVEAPLPHQFQLSQNYPNPFNPATTIPYALAEKADVTLTIYDLQGRQITRKEFPGQDAGWHQLVWMGRNDIGESLPAGVYVTRLQAGHRSATLKMLYLK